MTAVPLRGPTPDLIEDAIARHGAPRVLLAAALAMLRPRPRPPDVDALPPHLRRDMGLPPLPAPPPLRRPPF